MEFQETTPLKRIAITLAVLVAAAAILLAQSAPTPTELQRLRLLASYQHAVLTQQQAVAADQAFASAREAYTKLADDVAAEMHLPKGSQFAIDVSKQEVTVQLPPPAPKPPSEGAKK